MYLCVKYYRRYIKKKLMDHNVSQYTWLIECGGVSRGLFKSSAFCIDLNANYFYPYYN